MKAVIFDFGGVLINIDYQAPRLAFEALGYQSFGNSYSQAEQQEVFDLLETGQISPAKFYDEIRRLSGLDISDMQIRKAWDSILLDLPEDRLSLLSQLKHAGIPCFLLSNTNQLHIETIYQGLNERGIHDFPSFFNSVYLSYECGLRKPDEAFFKLLLEENQLNPQDCLFIEDSPQHRETARKLGIYSPEHATNAHPLPILRLAFPNVFH